MAKTETKKVAKTKKAPALPSKKTMNFVHHASSFNPKRVLPLAIVVIIVAIIISGTLLAAMTILSAVQKKKKK